MDPPDPCELVMEQTHTGEGHDDAVLVALLDDQIVPDGAAGLGNVLHTGGIGPLDVVREGEEGIGAQSHILTGGQPLTLVLLGQRFGLTGEVVLPDAVGADILFIAVDVAVNDVVPVGTAQILPEGQSLHRWPDRHRQSRRSWTGCISG